MLRQPITDEGATCLHIDPFAGHRIAIAIAIGRGQDDIGQRAKSFCCKGFHLDIAPLRRCAVDQRIIIIGQTAHDLHFQPDDIGEVAQCLSTMFEIDVA